ncbi:MAG: oligosaccharide flippase family protein [Alistipes sp.]|nr:oligosaccharide flippase family protein [Candidatus Minthomonas equi]
MNNAGLLKKLAGETAIYGMSTILARAINYLMVIVYTRVMSTSAYGVQAEFMGYVAVLQVLLTLGLETGCFRFANKEGYKADSVFSNALLTVAVLSVVVLLASILFSEPLAAKMGYPGFGKVYIYLGIILASDSITSILFARLRYQTRAWKFAIFRTLKILTEVVTSCFLVFFLPRITGGDSGAWIYALVSVEPDFTYPIFAILVSCLVAFLLFLPELVKFRFSIDRSVWKPLMLYSFPIMIAQLPGVVNDFMDRYLFRFFNVDDSLWRSELGIYQGCIKIAVLLSLFIQMFRYAAEPFFFSRAKDRNSRVLYAKVMEYFVAFCMLVFLGIMYYVDIFELLIGSDFRVGMDIVPVMLLAYVMLGMLFNVSMWYKLSDRSSFAIWITLAGVVVTTVINVVFLPRYSYHAAAWGHFFSYFTMLLISVILGNKYYKIPYRWGRIVSVIAVTLIFYWLSLLLPSGLNQWIRWGVCTVLLLGWLGLWYVTERRQPKTEEI